MMRSSPLRSTIVAGGLLACASLVRCSPTGSEPNALASFPAAAAMAEDASPIRDTPSGFALETRTDATARWGPASSVRAELSRAPGEPMWISAAGVPGRVGVIASDDDAPVAIGNVVRAGSSRFLFARAGTIEDLALAASERTREWRLVLPHGLSLRAIPDANVAEIVDANDRPLLRVRADRAWDALGRELTPSLTVSHETIRVTIPDGAHYPVLVDPTWTTSATPIFLRAGHTATSLGDGRVLFAGGGASPASTELYDPWSGRFVASGKMVVARTGHTATLLQNGKVLLAGGDTAASAELYDPKDGSFTATGSMSIRHGAAVRLASGKVLVTGGADASAELYDAATGTFTKTGPRSAAGGVALATLASGRILAFGDAGSDIYDPTKGTWTPVPSAPNGIFESATLTRFGNVLATMAQACVSASGDPRVCSMLLYDFDETANAGAGAFTQLAGGLSSIEGGLGATLLTNGSVLLVPSSGPSGGPPAATLYDPSTKTTSSDASLTTPHHGATATLLPGGDVLVAGGDQTSTDVRLAPGAISFSAMATARQGHGAVRLRDGRLLVVDSAAVGNPGPFACMPPPAPCPPPIPDQTRSAEIFDPATHLFAVTTGVPAFARALPLLVLLSSGKVLVTGGYVATGPLTLERTAEIFDPATGTFHDAGDMLKGRWGAQGALLPDGRVLVVGGFDGSSALGTTEIFDPKTETFSAGPSLLESLTGHGLVKLPTGKYLVVGSSTTEIFDPLTSTFRSAASPPASVVGSTAQLLADGRVFVASASTLASMLYDPATDAWSFSANGAFAADAVVWTPTVDGRVFSVGGQFAVGGESQQALYDPSSGRANVAANTGIRIGAAGAMLSSGETILAGGNSGAPEGMSHPLSSALIWSQGALPTSRPTITSIPPQVTGGATIAIAGTGFTSGAEGGTGDGRSSANAPTAVWLSDATGSIVPGRITDFTNTTATWIAPPTALTGHGWLFVYSNGVASAGAELTILASENAVHCRFDAECKTGFCTDGVCCDQRCDGVCQGCSAAHKTTGDDGVCGPVPTGNRDVAHRCFADNGQSCETPDECKSGFCIDGGGGKKLCCDAPCEGACLSCTQAASVGACTAVSEGACDVACDGAHTLKKVGQPDVDCTPFQCSGKTCRTSCASTHDCVAPFVCDESGACVAGASPPPSDVSLLGCSVSGAGAGADGDRTRALGVLATALAIVIASVRKRRAQTRRK